jgi:3,4-dihydroxy 2-butanone 4-phosphate synthase/GTP cyclohydrolase II
MSFTPIPEVLEEIRAGRMIVLVDDENRENEGDLCMGAEFATPEAVNFTARFGRGLICLALPDERCEALDLPMQVAHNTSRFETAFTVSVDAATGITTGISAADRARTIEVCLRKDSRPTDLVRPGHVFPLRARPGGVLERAGQTEGGVDLARLAGLQPAGVICEIMNDDGTMARLPDLVAFAQRHGLKIATIADLIAYRLRYDHLVKVVAQTKIDSAFGGAFDLKVYATTVDPAEHVAIVKGDVAAGGPVLVRVHALNTLDDVLSAGGHRETLVHKAMDIIGREGRGVIVLIRESRPDAISTRLGAEAGGGGQQRLIEYGIGAQILLDLGVREMVLLSNSPARKIVGLEGYGLKVTGHRGLGTTP